MSWKKKNEKNPEKVDMHIVRYVRIMINEMEWIEEGRENARCVIAVYNESLHNYLYVV